MRRHEHDHEQHEHHEHHETGARDAAAEAHERARTPHVLRAAVAGRTDVLGRAGMATLQRAVGNSAARTLVQRGAAGETEATEEPVEQPRSSVHDVVSSGGGQALDPETRTDMETRLGADFSDVRVHTDAAAHDSAKEVGAHAYTVGNNVVFQRDAYDTSSRQGRTMLAHELTHVVQQRSGPVDGAEAPGGIRVSDPGDRFEQEAASTAERVMAEPPAPTPQPTESAAPQPAAAPAAVQLSAAPAVQRAAEEGEDEEPADVQGAFVQRAERKPEEEEEETPPE
ncbi:DUF4157 domain-containing protein [Streptomyces sp. AC536]|uniref:eCIS core domain-containing protein n=1 Tax=Streptomyces buecherae TaxID=2763006 RepID=UPI00164E8267|nr:DUF4157 domain-containing protein [Streptomyces buecherae]MBC3982208.1 DUF4157 domain-containing protein [Streptomyces buecherae]QNJ43489.1 DUF4157 domain-containing protein [Streptomyces buecherae]